MKKLVQWLQGLLRGKSRSSDVTAPSRPVTGDVRQFEIERDVLKWRDTYVSRIDREMTSSFPDLERALLKSLESNLWLVLTNQSKRFNNEILRPEVEAWVSGIVEPIRDEASRTLAAIDLRRSQVGVGDFEVPYVTTLVLPIAAVIAGVGVMITGYIAAVTTTFFVFTSISWPILVGTAGVGIALASLGVTRLSRAKEWLARNFSKRFVPKLREALIGEGYRLDGEHHPSIRRQLQQSIEAAADSALAHAAKE